MKLPIIAYGHPVLRKKAVDILLDDIMLKPLIADMFETMYAAKGVGLAAPQIGLSIRLFIIDAAPFKELKFFKKVFINARISREYGDAWLFNEGCLSVPDIHEDIKRQQSIVISYVDEEGITREETYNGMAARIIQHEYDHLEGMLFVDKLSNLRKEMLKNKLKRISEGLVKADYRMKFYDSRKNSKKR